MKNKLFNIWKEAKSPMDYLVVVWIYALIGLIGLGLGKIIFEIVTNPYQFNGLKFGIFDYV
jgi:hypothetical protein